MNAGNHNMLAMVFRRGRLPGLALAVALAAVATAPPRAEAAIAYWTGVGGASWGGNGGTQNWSSTVANPGVPYTPVNGDELRWLSFSTSNKESTNNLDGLSVSTISFQGAPSGIVLSGNTLTVTGTIGSTSGGGAGTINLPLQLNGATVVIGGVTGDTITVNGVISETGGSRGVRVNGGTITLSGANSFSGNVQLAYTTAAPTVTINSLADVGTSQSLGSGSLVTFGFRTFDATLVYTGGATSTNKGFAIGENQSTGTDKYGGGSFVNNGTGAVTWTGAQTLLSQPSTLTRTFGLGGSNAGDNDWQSAIKNNTGGLVAFTKTGTGKWILSGANTYTGATSVQQGVLLVDGSTAAGSAVTVSSAAVFGGDGTVSGNLTLSSGALFAFDTGSTLDLAGTLTLDSSFAVASLRNTSGGAVDWANVAQGTYTLMNTSFSFNDTNISNFGVANQATGLAGGKSAYFQQGTSPTSSLELVVVPEPTALALMAVGSALSGLVAWRRRRG